MEERRSISTHKIEDLVKSTPNDRVPIADLISAMEGAGFGLTLLIFSFGILIPLPPPFPSVIAIPMVIFSFQMMIGLPAPKLPKKFEKLTIKRAVLGTLVRKASPYIGKIEKILRPRLIFMMSKLAERIVGTLVFAFSAFVLIPVPFSNLIPGLGVLIVSFGMIGRDGLVMLIGIFVGFVGMVVSVLAIVLGFEAIHYIKDFLF